jgi:hypothetical protein
VGVDASGGAVIDPTANVTALVVAGNQRQDDLRDANNNWIMAQIEKITELVKTYAEHHKELAIKESSRLDSIRQVDREEVAKTAAQNNLAITTLAKQTTDLSSTLQAQVQASAQAVEARRQADMTEVNKRVSALELALSASAGRSTVADPALVELTTEVRKLAASRDEGSGRAAVVDPQFVAALAELKVLREKDSTRTGFDAGKAAAVAGGLAAAGGIGALLVKLMQH